MEEELTEGQKAYIALIKCFPDLALWGGDPDCKHEETPVISGGTKCKYCTAWFRF